MCTPLDDETEKHPRWPPTQFFATWYWAALEGDVRDTKRVRLNDFSRGLGIVTTKDNANFWAFTRV